MGELKVAVMQPYLFPYVGYFQLIKAVDRFVCYDDVNFIKQGWINRNKILVNNQDYIFTIPLNKASSFTPIKDTLINHQFYRKWTKKFLRTINQNYSKAPFFGDVFPLIESVFEGEHVSIGDMAAKSVKKVASYLNLKTKFFTSSIDFPATEHLDRADRLIKITKELEGKNYINAIGGVELYQKEYFNEKGVNLFFIKSETKEYKQFSNKFVPHLSIIDVLMFNSIEEVNKMLDQYKLI